MKPDTELWTIMSEPWWRHQMETFSALLAICAGNSPVTGEFPTQRPATRSFDILFDLRLNKQLSKQSWGWWFETPSRPLWRHCNTLSIWTSRSHFNTSKTKPFYCQLVMAYTLPYTMHMTTDNSIVVNKFCINALSFTVTGFVEIWYHIH